MTRFRPLLAILAGALLLGACGALPRPFQPAEKAPPQALEQALGARAGVFVEPIAGIPLADSERHQSVTVDWTVLAPDGARIGTVSQSNAVPAGSLDGAWGPVARAVAENGAQGIVAMLRRIGALE